MLPQLEDIPVYATKLTNGLIRVKLKERRIREGVNLKVLNYGQEVSLGRFKVELFPRLPQHPRRRRHHRPLPRRNHHPQRRFQDRPYARQGQTYRPFPPGPAGRPGVLLLLSDSTYAELPGYTPSERIVGESMENVIANAPGRVIVTTFSSLISASSRSSRRR
jgi:ribonuclease J